MGTNPSTRASHIFKYSTLEDMMENGGLKEPNRALQGEKEFGGGPNT